MSTAGLNNPRKAITSLVLSMAASGACLIGLVERRRGTARAANSSGSLLPDASGARGLLGKLMRISHTRSGRGEASMKV
jgi:hypothetical protein